MRHLPLIAVSIQLLAAAAFDADVLVARARNAPALMFNGETLSLARARVRDDADARAWWAGFRKDVDRRIASGVKVPPVGAQWFHWYSCRTCGVQLRGETPKRHVCPKCGEVHAGWPYDESYWFKPQHACGRLVRDAGVVYAISGDAKYSAAARDVLLAYARVYASYVRHDNNGPTEKNRDAARAFSQILDESVWLIDLVQGYDAVREALSATDRATICDGLIRPAADLIYAADNVGRSILGNHQCWHFSAYALAALVLGDTQRVRESAEGPSGWKYQLSHGVLRDGCWYEGAWSYHFYTMNALVPYFTALANLGEPPPDEFKAMFYAPFGLLTPDWKLPAANDSGRMGFAPGACPELYELAWSWWKDPAVGWWVAQRPRRTMAHALWGSPVPGNASFKEPVSQVYGANGFAVLRSRSACGRDAMPDNYLALDFGAHGGYHGHPDKLNLILWGRGKMWAEDPGCIGYGNPLHWGWYKSTLAHNTLVMDGKNQEPSTGKLIAFSARPNETLVALDAGEAYPGAHVVRCTALVGDVVLDYVRARSSEAHAWEWAFHSRGDQTCSVAGTPVRTVRPQVAGRRQWEIQKAALATDPWQWTDDVREGRHDGRWNAAWTQGDSTLRLFQKCAAGTVRTAKGSAQPPPETFRLAVSRVSGRQAEFCTVFTLDGSADVVVGDAIAGSDGTEGFSAVVNSRRFILTLGPHGLELKQGEKDDATLR